MSGMAGMKVWKSLIGLQGRAGERGQLSAGIGLLREEWYSRIDAHSQGLGFGAVGDGEAGEDIREWRARVQESGRGEKRGTALGNEADCGGTGTASSCF
jgi:hypothetical protein